MKDEGLFFFSLLKKAYNFLLSSPHNLSFFKKWLLVANRRRRKRCSAVMNKCSWILEERERVCERVFVPFRRLLSRMIYRDLPAKHFESTKHIVYHTLWLGLMEGLFERCINLEPRWESSGHISGQTSSHKSTGEIQGCHRWAVCDLHHSRGS